MKFFYYTCVLKLTMVVLGTTPALTTEPTKDWTAMILDKGTAPACVPPLIQNGSFCYDVQKNPQWLSWIGSQEFCQSEGGYLITLHSIEEVELMFRLLAEAPIYHVYLGLRAAKNLTKYIWLDDDTEPDLSIMAWSPNEPNKWGGSERCGSSYTHHANYRTANNTRQFLNDYTCDNAIPGIGFICKIPITASTPRPILL